ncbi:hypothetical protein ACFL1Z_00330 [Thermodesulfobacteriota bacterium]
MMNTRKIKYIIHELVEVTISAGVSLDIIRSIDFQIGYFKSSKASPAVKLKIVVKPYEEFICQQVPVFEIFHLVNGITGRIYNDPANRLAFEKNEKEYYIFADKPNFLINIFIQLWFVENGISMVHAAAVTDDSGRVIVFPGPGGVGKTAIIGYMAKERGFHLLGDDIVGITKKGACLSFPRSFVLKEYHRDVYPDVFHNLNIKTNPKKPFGNKIKRFILENAPFAGISRAVLKRLGLFETVVKHLLPQSSPKQPYLADVSVEDVFGRDIVRDKGTIERIIFMQRYSGKNFLIETISEEALSQRMFAIINHEWVDSMRQLFSLGALEFVDLAKYFKNVDDIIKGGIRKKKCEIISIPNNAPPHELAEYFPSIL